MRRSAMKILALLVILASAFMGGCNGEQEQIRALRDKNESLTIQNKDYRDQIAEYEDSNRRLEEEIVGKDKLIAELKAAPPVIEKQPVELADGWERGKFGDRVTVGSDILFSPGKATLQRSGKRALGQILSELTNRYSGMTVRVYGYTDSDPIKKSKRLWKDNLDLSSNRAMAVVRHLKKNGVAKENIEAVGMGDSNPIASNTNKSGKARNRRVEIVVVKTGD